MAQGETEPALRWTEGKPTHHDVVVPVIHVISSAGRVTDIEVEASLVPDLDAAAVRAAQQWTFLPARNEGVAVASRGRAVVRFFGERRRRRINSGSA
jgi:iron complex outermembrane receptor protein